MFRKPIISLIHSISFNKYKQYLYNIRNINKKSAIHKIISLQKPNTTEIA